jgi:uncharacterized membrane protein
MLPLPKALKIASRATVTVLAIATFAILYFIGIGDATRRGLDAVGTLSDAKVSSALSELDARNLAESARALGATPGTKDYARLETMYVGMSLKYAARPAVTLLHVTSGILVLLLAPLQLWSRFRNRYFRVHRICGRIVLGAAAGLLLSGAYFGWVGPTGGSLEGSAVGLFGCIFVLAGARAYVLIRRGDVLRHREWMIRMFAIALGSSTIRLLSIISLALMSAGPGMINARSVGLVFWFGWLLTIAFAELWIRRTRRGNELAAD